MLIMKGKGGRQRLPWGLLQNQQSCIAIRRQSIKCCLSYPCKARGSQTARTGQVNWL